MDAMTTSRRATKSTTSAASAKPAVPVTEATTSPATSRNRPTISGATVVKLLITAVALVAVAAVTWLLVTSAGLATFPQPADDASDAAKVGSFMIRFGLVVIAIAVAVLLGTQIIGLLIPRTDEPRTATWVDFMKALGDLIKTPAGIGFGVVILGIILMFPTVFAGSTP
jgi:ABC-type transport system involved in cytochrome c biogenesis permease subunit